jgi:DNA-binding transcriptional LysR family regulator
MAIRVNHLRAFRAIFEAGSFTTAAEKLFLTQSTVSKQLLSLEQEVGFRLFHRRSGGIVTATTEGRRFFEQVETVLGGIDDLKLVATGIRRNSHFRLRITATEPAMSSSILMKTLNALLEEHPDLRLSLDTRRRLNIEELVANRRTDIGIALLPTSSERLEEIPLVTAAAVAVVSRSHRLADRHTIDMQELAGETIILPDAQLMRAHLAQVLGEDELAQRTQFEASSGYVCCRLATAGMGVAIVDSLTASSFSRNDLIVLPLTPNVPLTYGLLVPPQSTRPDIVGRAIELFLESAGNQKEG